MLRIRTRERRMVGADESTELWWPHIVKNISLSNQIRNIIITNQITYREKHFQNHSLRIGIRTFEHTFTEVHLNQLCLILFKK